MNEIKVKELLSCVPFSNAVEIMVYDNKGELLECSTTDIVSVGFVIVNNNPVLMNSEVRGVASLNIYDRDKANEYGANELFISSRF